MALSKIEWTDYTLNHWNGCTAIAPECDNCYAEARDARFNKGEAIHWGAGAERMRHLPATRNAARKWNRMQHAACAVCGWRGPWGKCPECDTVDTLYVVRARVFAQSLADTFDNEVPDEWRAELLALAEECTNLDFLFLTKRIGNVRKMVPPRWLEPGGWPKHIRLGVTAGTQEAADRDIPRLLALPCPNFVSMEPLLELVVLRDEWMRPQCDNGSRHVDAGGVTCMRCGGNGPSCHGLQWAITGGESGRVEGIRPMHPAWPQRIVDDCIAHDVPVLHKQNGEWMPMGLLATTAKSFYMDIDGSVVSDADYAAGKGGNPVRLARVGKDNAGRLLNGRTWDGYP